MQGVDVSRLRGEIRGCMSALRTEPDGRVSATFVFPPEFTGFSGHFDGNPVLPGVCVLQSALVLAEDWLSAPVVLRELVSAKFRIPIGPGQELVVTCRKGDVLQDGRELLFVRAQADGRAVADLQLEISLAGGGA